MSNYYKSGDWNVVCPVCGFHYKSGELKRRWDGVMVCRDDWEPRHPLDLIKAPSPEQAIPWSSPEPDITYLDVTYNTRVESTIPSGSFTDDATP